MLPAIQQAIALGFKRILVPPIDLSFLKHLNRDVDIVPLRNMEALIAYLNGQPSFDLDSQEVVIETPAAVTVEMATTDFASIRGHEQAKSALEIPAAGRHHLLLTGLLVAAKLCCRMHFIRFYRTCYTMK